MRGNKKTGSLSKKVSGTNNGLAAELKSALGRVKVDIGKRRKNPHAAGGGCRRQNRCNPKKIHRKEISQEEEYEVKGGTARVCRPKHSIARNNRLPE